MGKGVEVEVAVVGSMGSISVDLCDMSTAVIRTCNASRRQRASGPNWMSLGLGALSVRATAPYIK